MAALLHVRIKEKEMKNTFDDVRVDQIFLIKGLVSSLTSEFREFFEEDLMEFDHVLENLPPKIRKYLEDDFKKHEELLIAPEYFVHDLANLDPRAVIVKLSTPIPTNFFGKNLENYTSSWGYYTFDYFLIHDLDEISSLAEAFRDRELDRARKAHERCAE